MLIYVLAGLPGTLWIYWQLRDAVRVERARPPRGQHSTGIPSRIPAKTLLVALQAETMRSYPGRPLAVPRG